jgi:hypothetical protein
MQIGRQPSEDMRDERARERLAERYRAARAELADRLFERSRIAGVDPPMPVEYLAWAALALGTGLAVQAYLELDALPDALYRTVIAQLFGGASGMLVDEQKPDGALHEPYEGAGQWSGASLALVSRM